jgi:hypothetical protein
MKQHPILFSTPMVQAILEGRKTQTRRTSKLDEINSNPDDYIFQGFSRANPKNVFGALFMHKSGMMVFIPCPYGQVGDMLWVREEHKIWSKIKRGDKCETWFCEFRDGTKIDIYCKGLELKTLQNLRKRKTLGKWQRARFLPKDFAFRFLQITDIRIERLQNISEQDAIAEGIESWIEERLRSKPTHYKVYYWDDDEDSTYSSSAITSYETLWQKINGSDSWNKNPWVWVIEFKQFEKPC